MASAFLTIIFLDIMKCSQMYFGTWTDSYNLQE